VAGPFLLGLTGNIACGKSTVGRMLAEGYGAEYVDADRLVHALYAAGTPETTAIAARFGADLLQPDGTINRRRLGDLVMSSREALRELEGILDPGVASAIAQRVANSTAPVLVLDAIRLIESGLAAHCDAVWVVLCDRDLQLRRLQSSRSLSPDQAAVRVAAQTPAEDKLRHAGAVITNNGGLDDLQRQIDAAWNATVQPALGT
jgi:dephospho-CoA kinase